MRTLVTCISIVLAAGSVCADDQFSELTGTSPTWDRNTDTGATVSGFCGGATAPDSINNTVPYERFAFRVLAGGAPVNVTVRSLESEPLDFDPVVAVYCDNFDPSMPDSNLLLIDDDGAGYPDARAVSGNVFPSNSRFTIVVSSYSNWAPSQLGQFVVQLGPNLEFLCPADLVPPYGTLNFFDLGEFLTLFNAQDPTADLAPPFGVWNFFDLGEFLTQFNQPCP